MESPRDGATSIATSPGMSVAPCAAAGPVLWDTFDNAKTGLQFALRDAQVEDLPAVHKMVYDLAVFEEEEHQFTLPLDQLIRDSGLPGSGSTEPPRFQCLVAEQSPGDAAQAQLVGFALYFFTYSTWEGRAMYLEDLYVRPEARVGGLGTRMMFLMAKIAAVRGCCRLQWQCLDWNETALSFYYNKLRAEERVESNKAKWINIWVKRDRIQDMAVEFDAGTRERRPPHAPLA